MRQERGSFKRKRGGFRKNFKGRNDDRQDTRPGQRKNSADGKAEGPTKFKGKRIGKPLRNKKGHPQRKRDPQNRDLDRELRNYFVRTEKDKQAKDQNGENAPTNNKEKFGERLQEKLNSEMDEYWKARKQQAAQKKAQ